MEPEKRGKASEEFQTLRQWAKNDSGDKTPSIWPTLARVTLAFGPSVHPTKGTEFFHRGIDIANRRGEPVVATAPGLVLQAEDLGVMGLTVVIDHDNGLVTRYCHLGQLAVEAGQRIGRGHKIGLIGVSGKSTGPHVHYEVILDGKHQDPQDYMN